MLINFVSTEIKERIISAILIGSTFIFFILLAPTLFIGLLLIIAYLMLKEWYIFAHSSKSDLAVGALSIAFSISSLILLCHAIPAFITVLYFLIIWSTDTGAMVGGKILKGPKLAQRISPNKTWSGSLVGIITAVLTVYLISRFYKLSNLHNFFLKFNPILFTIIISCISQISDLFISIFKRKHKIKDSGSIIPGHGGVLDRFDSIILTTPAWFLLFAYY